MSDLFHKDVPRDLHRSGLRHDGARGLARLPGAHQAQLAAMPLSQGPLRELDAHRLHIWCGVSVEDAQAKSRIAHLRAAPASIRFLSLEPLLGHLGGLDLTGIDWVIVGGESGPGARPMDADWVRSIRDQCVGQGVAFFFKQWGGVRPKSGGRTLDNREWSEYPQSARVHRSGGVGVTSLSEMLTASSWDLVPHTAAKLRYPRRVSEGLVSDRWPEPQASTALSTSTASLGRDDINRAKTARRSLR